MRRTETEKNEEREKIKERKKAQRFAREINLRSTAALLWLVAAMEAKLLSRPVNELNKWKNEINDGLSCYIFSIYSILHTCAFIFYT